MCAIHPDKLLFFFFVISPFSFFHFLDVSLLPTQRLFAVYIESTLLALILVALLQFAFVFLNRETTIRTQASHLSCLLDICFGSTDCTHTVQSASPGRWFFEKTYLDFIPPILFAWVIIVFL